MGGGSATSDRLTAEVLGHKTHLLPFGKTFFSVLGENRHVMHEPTERDETEPSATTTRVPPDGGDTEDDAEPIGTATRTP